MGFFTNRKLDDVLKDIYKKTRIKRYFYLVLGCFCIAVAFNLFYAPNDLVVGGVSGISIIVNEFFGMDPSLVILVLSLILLVISYFTLGLEKTKNTILGTILFPIFVKLTAHIAVYIDLDASEMLLAAIFGGLLNGFGAGLLFKAGFTTGGTDIINQIVSKYAKVSLGKAMLMTDGLIVLAGGFIFGFTKLMYSIIVLYIISLMTDRVVLGISDSKAFYIITQEEKEVKNFILKYLHHGVTSFQAHGGYNDKKQTVLMCVIPTKEYFKLKEGIHQIDASAFFVVTDAYEVFGGE